MYLKNIEYNRSKFLKVKTPPRDSIADRSIYINWSFKTWNQVRRLVKTEYVHQETIEYTKYIHTRPTRYRPISKIYGVSEFLGRETKHVCIAARNIARQNMNRLTVIYFGRHLGID